MNEQPILFSTPMVKALLDGRKMQTRRVITPQPKFVESSCRWYWEKALDVHGEPLVDASRHWWEYYGTSPYGAVGDRLWLRETFCVGYAIGGGNFTALLFDGCENVRKVFYRATDDDEPDEPKRLWKPSIFMPRWASRITLELTAVRVERVQDISRTDAIAEGVCTDEWLEWRENALSVGLPEGSRIPDEIDEYAGLWNKLNFKRGYGWEVNPWVWVLEFKRVQP